MKHVVLILRLAKSVHEASSHSAWPVFSKKVLPMKAIKKYEILSKDKRCISGGHCARVTTKSSPVYYLCSKTNIQKHISQFTL